MNNQESLNISWGTMLRVAIVFFSLYFIYLVKDILVLSVFGLIISILFEIPIRFLERKIPRVLAVVLLYAFTFLFISAIIYLPASKFMSEIKQFIALFPTYFEQASPILQNLGIEAFQNLESFVSVMESTIRGMTSNILSVVVSIFGGIASTVFVVSIAIFLSLEGKDVERNIVLLFPEEDENFMISLWRKCQKKVGFWFLRSIISSLFVGVFSFIAFSILKTKYPLVLGLVSGALNFVPVIGPIFASFLIFVVLVLDSTTKAFFALIISILIQQIENNVITPLITKKLVGLSPVLVLISLTIGAQLFGLLGAILAIPLIGVIVEFVKGLMLREKQNLSGNTEKGPEQILIKPQDPNSSGIEFSKSSQSGSIKVPIISS
ncbi:MAG: AI-2E family transporter [Candidatus Pacebacteria bacterium]|nr:AI-2E family transporter [Candidatus Paceibacterota bacterium]